MYRTPPILVIQLNCILLGIIVNNFYDVIFLSFFVLFLFLSYVSAYFTERIMNIYKTYNQLIILLLLPLVILNSS